MGIMKISKMRQTKIDRTLTSLDTDTVPCDICDKDLVKGDIVNKANFREGCCSSSVNVCPSCYEERLSTIPAEDIFKFAVDERGRRMQNIMDNLPSL
jgi:hypothetical protein